MWRSRRSACPPPSTGLVDAYSTATLLDLLATRQIDAGRFITHHFTLDEFDQAYDVFGRAADTGALKVVLNRKPGAGAVT